MNYYWSILLRMHEYVSTFIFKVDPGRLLTRRIRDDPYFYLRICEINCSKLPLLVVPGTNAVLVPP